MEAAVANNYYWDLLKDLSDERKLDLIDRLARSLIRKEKAQPDYASQLYGIWKDEDFPDADTMVKELKEARKFKDDISDLLV